MRQYPMGLLMLSVVAVAVSMTQADIVAIKRTPGTMRVLDNLDARFQSAVTGGTVTYVTGPDAVADADLYNSTTASQYNYMNRGANGRARAGYPVLWKFKTSTLPNFIGGKIDKAQLRLYNTAGNTGPSLLYYVTSSDWSEGNKGDGGYNLLVGSCDYPGKAPALRGVTGAHPNGINTDQNQNSEGGTTPPLFSWANNAVFDPAKDCSPSTVSFGGRTVYTGTMDDGTTLPYDAFFTTDVTSIVQAWANGTPNYGFCLPGGGWNYWWEMSETIYGPNFQPVLFIDYIQNAPPGAVTDLAVTSVDWYKLTLQWTAPSDSPPGPVARYELRMSTSPITDDASFDAATPLTGVPTPAAPGTVQTMTISSGLLPDTTYYFAVNCYDISNLVSPLNTNGPVSGTTLVVDAVAPGQIGDLAAPADTVRSNSLTLAWTAVADDDASPASGLAVSYDLRYSTSPITDDATFAAATAVAGLAAPKAAGSAETFTLHGLAPSTTYYFAIKARDEVPNWSIPSNVVTVTTKEVDTFPPQTIVNLRSTGGRPRAIYVSWAAPADIGSAGMAGYDVRYSTSPITSDADFAAATAVSGLPVPAAAGTTESATIGGLTPDTTYSIAIKSFDYAEPANVSAISNVISVKTPPLISAVTVHNPWLVNDRVADTHNINTIGATYGNAYTPNGVIAPTTDEQKAINVYNNQKRRLYHWADEPPALGGNSISDPTYNQNVFGWALCGRHANQGVTCATAAGLTARFMSLPGHNVYEVQYSDGTWHLYDTMTTMYCFTKTTPPHVASCAEIGADRSILLNAVADKRACPGFLLCRDDPTWYAGAAASASIGSTTPQTCLWTGNMDLRIGQTFKRTWESWLNQYPTPVTDANGDGKKDPPFHHDCDKGSWGDPYGDENDTVNYLYWEPYQVPYDYAQSIGVFWNHSYRRWSNGTDTLAPDFLNGGYTALLDSTSHHVLAFCDDAVTPDLHAQTVGTQGEAVFKVNVPFYITDASFSGDFTKTNTGDVCKVYVSKDGSSWTQVYDAPVGTTHVTNQSLRTSVFGTWTTWYIKVQIKATNAKSDAGVSNLVVTTIFEHNKGAMAYLDKGVNNITLTFDNPAELAASGNCIHVTYKWKEYAGNNPSPYYPDPNDGINWTIDRQFDTYVTTSPYTFTITTGGTKVPRTEYIAMEITQPDVMAPSPISDVTAGATTRNSAQLTWTATGDDGSQGTASRYDIRYSTSPITDMTSFNAAAAATGLPLPQTAGSPETFTVTGLAPTTSYYFAVVAYDKGTNCSGLSNVVTATTLPDIPPAPVADLAAPAVTKNSVQLTWTATGDDGSVGTAARYDLRYSTSAITDMASFNAATAVTGVTAPKASGQAETFTVTGLSVATSYNFALVVYDTSNIPSGLSNMAAATTLVDTPPAAVTDLFACSTCITRTSIQLTWTASGEDGSVGTASRYDLRYSTSAITDMASFNAATVVTGLSAPKAPGQAESVTVSGLTAGTTYYFALVVYDAASQGSGLSNIVTAATRPPRKLGDIDDDGQVNLADLKLLVAAWNSQGGGAYANWNPDADLDGDNNVNLSDLKILVAHWNQ